jgi:hypothetical protein
MEKKEVTEIFLILFILSIIYLWLKHFIVYWEYIVYPITILVTFLHEFGHSFFAILTWWWVKNIQINPDGSWFATTYWWIRFLVLMWWYIGSAIFWNILLYIWAKKEKLSSIVIILLAVIMLFVSVFFMNFSFSWFISSFILISLSIFLIFTSFKLKQDSFNRIFLMFIWLASIFYIIEDFNVWPSSDLKKFSEIFVFIPQFIWMFIWLIIVIFITWFNFKKIFFKK